MTFARVKPTGWTDNVDTITAEQLNILDTNMTGALDGVSGGTYTPAAVLNVNGAGGGSSVALGGDAPAAFGGATGGILLTETVGAPSNIQLTTRSVTRYQSLIGAGSNPAVPDWSIVVPTFQYRQLVAYVAGSDGILRLYLDVPHNQRLTGVHVRIDPANGAPAGPHDVAYPAPAGSPSIAVREVDLDGLFTTIATGADAAADMTAYQALHTISATWGGSTIDRTQYSYCVDVFGEGGAFFIAAMKVVSVYTIVECTGYTEY